MVLVMSTFANFVAQGQLTAPIQYPLAAVGNYQPFVMSNIYKGEFADPTNHLAAGMDAYKQLKVYPSPRYKPGATLNRNVNVLAIGPLTETAYPCSNSNLPGCQAMLFNHAAINLILAQRWNYYFDIGINKPGICLPLAPNSGVPANGTPIDHSPKLITTANAYPNIPISVITHITQLGNSPTPAISGPCCPGCTPPIVPTPPINSYNASGSSTSATPPFAEPTPASPSFFTKNSNSSVADAANMPRQNNQFMANDYYLHTTDGSIYALNTGTPCSTTEPCFYGDQNSGWGYYKYTATYKPKKYFSPFAFRNATATGCNSGATPGTFLGESFEQDGKTQGYYLNMLMAGLTRPNPKNRPCGRKWRRATKPRPAYEL
jgi:hypothetical protein